MVPLKCSPHEVQTVKDALRINSLNSGLGILHEPTGQIHLIPIDIVGGHVGFAILLGLPENEWKGFGIGINPDGTFTAMNVSQLNGPLGQLGSLQMPQSTFQSILQALQGAGL